MIFSAHFGNASSRLDASEMIFLIDWLTYFQVPRSLACSWGCHLLDLPACQPQSSRSSCTLHQVGSRFSQYSRSTASKGPTSQSWIAICRSIRRQGKTHMVRKCWYIFEQQKADEIGKFLTLNWWMVEWLWILLPRCGSWSKGVFPSINWAICCSFWTSYGLAAAIT